MRTLLIALSVPFCTTVVCAQQILPFPPHLFEFPDDAFAIELAGDVDGDGDVDLIAFDSNGGPTRTAFSPRLLDATGVFRALAPVALPAGVGRRSRLVDLDGDGLPELVLSADATHALGTGFTVQKGLGGGAFGPAVHQATGGAVRDLHAGNANGDAIGDLLVRHDTGTQMQIMWYHGSTGGGLVAAQGVTTAPTEHGVVLDVDGDGIDDVANLQDGGSQVDLLATTATQLSPFTSLALPGGLARALVAVDWEQDGRTDLLAVLENATPGTERWVRLHQGASASWSVGGSFSQIDTNGGAYYAADWDGDGLTDIGARYRQGAGVTTHQIRVVYNSGAQFAGSGGVFVTVPDAVADRGVGIVDLDGNGDVDWVDNRAIFASDGSHTFGAAYQITPTVNDLVDWDGDGDVEPRGGGLRNDGQGNMVPRSTSFPGPGVDHQWVSPSAPFDIDGDGLHERIVGRFYTPAFQIPLFVGMHLWREQGDGAWLDMGLCAPLALEFETDGVFLDVDGDGDRDYLQKDGIYDNDGSEFFTLNQLLPGDWLPVAVGDVDGDGEDEAVGDATFGTGIAIFDRDSSNQFVATPVPTPGFVDIQYRHHLVDLDDDGDLDLAGSRYISTAGWQIVIYQNDGIGNFTLHGTIPGADTLSFGDLNGDGTTDIAAYGAPSSHLHVHLRKGPGLVYETRARIPLRSGQTVTSMHDIDQDGDLDLCGDEMLFNLKYDGPTAGYRRQYGSGSFGTGSPNTGPRQPLFSVVGPIRGGSTPVMRLRHAVGGSISFLFVGLGEANVPSPFLPGTTIYIGGIVLILDFPLTGAFGAAGQGGFDVPLPIPQGIGGTRLFFETLELDPGAPFDVTHSNGCEVYVGM